MKQVVLLKSRIACQGGAEKYTQRLAIAFHKRKCEVTLLTNGPLPKESFCEIISDEELPLLSFRRVQKFDQFCKKILPVLKPDVVFGLDRNSHQTHLRASNGVHAAYLDRRKKESSFLKKLSFDLNPLHRTLLKIEKRSFEDRFLEKLFVNSQMVQKEIEHYYHVDPQKIGVIHNGVEWEEMENDFQVWEEKKRETLQAFNLSPDVFHFLFVGHNYRRKGLEVLLQALSLLPHENFHLSVVGKENRLLAFKTLTRALNLEKKVSFFPAQKEIVKFYQYADALVIPSFYDPFANVTVEALAMGLYTVSSTSNGGSEVIEKECGALIEDLYNRESVVEALKKALSYPKTKESAMRIRTSVRHLDFSTQLERYVDEILL